MKVKVKKRFVDRDTKQIREIGKIYEYGEARAKDLQKRGYVDPVEESAEKAK